MMDIIIINSRPLNVGESDGKVDSVGENEASELVADGETIPTEKRIIV